MMKTFRNKPFARLDLLILLLALLAACGSEETLATAVSPQPTMAEGVAVPTATTAATPTIQPTLPPPAVSTAVPTVTTEAAPTAPAVVVLSSWEDFGDNRNIFTGELVTDTAVLQRRPLAIKISNNPPTYARPQSGIGQADIVYEHVTEANITRFTAIFYSQTPEDVGPVRSARLIDKELPAMYDAVLVMSGSHELISQRLYASDIGDSILNSQAEGFYRTGEDKPWEHTLHVRPAQLWQDLDELGKNRSAPA